MKIGNMYQTKSNKTVTVISVTEHPTHPVMVVDIKGKTHMYTKDGCYIEKGFPHKMDIVEI
jgi:hypothetical protein